jgi:F5/8 type C domain
MVHRLLMACVVCLACAGHPIQAQVTLDRFDDLDPWKAGASTGVDASLHPAQGVGGPALRLDFDLRGTAGYALAARALPLGLPANYEITFDLRADAPVNDFQVKLVDETGENVWWFRRQNFAFPREWQRVRIKKRHIEFAWGPTQDRTLRRAARIEFVVAAGRGGGAGSVYVGNLSLRELPPERTAWGTPVVLASSFVAGGEPLLAVDGQSATAWQSDPAAGREQTLMLDFGEPREFGGLVLRWEPGKFASRYDVQFSDDAREWKTVRSVAAGRGDLDPLLLPEAETRYVRLALHDGPAAKYALSEVEVRDLGFGASHNAFFEAVAREFPRGYFPRGFSGQQSYWTIVGVDGGSDTGLLSEDGALEVARGGFSIEPFVRVGSRVVTWADVDMTQSLRNGYLPIPSVTWRQPQWTLKVTAFAAGDRARSRLVATYEIRNLGNQPLPLELVLAIRPSQVNPPAQFLNAPSGVASISNAAWNGGALTVNDTRTVFPLHPPKKVGAFDFDSGPLVKLISDREWNGRHELRDPFGYASTALEYPLTIAPGASATVAVAVPLTGADNAELRGIRNPDAWIARDQDRVAALWHRRLDDVVIKGPAEAQPLLDTLRTAFAHLLITRDGPILRPGTRAYARSWIRDGTMIGESLMRLGRADVAADYLRWYATHQYADGKIPCCVDERGADPVPEHDSAGQFVFLADEVFRYTGDRALLVQMWPHVRSAMQYLDDLRRSRPTSPPPPELQPALRGLLPASISHEGYSAKPMHSYWDDFWALKGYGAAVRIAAALGHSREGAMWRRDLDAFERDVAASLQASASLHRIDYMPGAAELGDFDATSSTIAFAPGGNARAVPAQLIRPTFERYWREFVARRDGVKAWEDYTPYELRTVGTFVRLGWRERTHELLAFFMADRRPAGWNQWAEVVGRDPRKPRFVGDMPHAWIASDFIRSVLDLFAYERNDDHALVLGAGIPMSWLEDDGVRLSGLHTAYGRLSYRMRRSGDRLLLHVDGGLRLPAGGIVVPWPGRGAPAAARVNGKPAVWHDGELRITRLPADVTIDLANGLALNK